RCWRSRCGCRWPTSARWARGAPTTSGWRGGGPPGPRTQSLGGRRSRLRDAGLKDDERERLSSPIGLDLGARTPEETAVSIAAEIIAGRWGGSGERLVTTNGRIHHDTVEKELRLPAGV